MFSVLGDDCVKSLDKGLFERGAANFIVSGGSTPIPLFNQLSKAQMSWKDVTVALVDERWVPECHAASNAKLVRSHLLNQHAAEASFVGMRLENSPLVTAVKLIDQRYRKELMPMDLVILGMGADGHTASLFPHAQGLTSALNESGHALCASITAVKSPVTGEFINRMTLTLTALIQAKHVILLYTGDEKKETYQQALINKNWSKMPVSAVLQHEKIDVSVYSAI